MNLSLSELLKDETIAKTSPNKEAALNSLKLSERDLKTCEKVFESEDFDWSLAIAYNAMLQAGIALMFFKGFRPNSASKHFAVSRFVSIFKKSLGEDLTKLFEKTRKRRHVAVYDFVETVSKSEAENAIKKAKEFVNKIKQIIK